MFCAYAAVLMTTPRYHVALDDGLDNVIVVDGVPMIDKSKLEKLLSKISKEFTKKGAPIKPENIFVPWDNVSAKSKGYTSAIFDIGGLLIDHSPVIYSLMQGAQTQRHLRSMPCMVILSTQSTHFLSIDLPISTNMRTWMKRTLNPR